jgi:hypothetical protein
MLCLSFLNSLGSAISSLKAAMARYDCRVVNLGVDIIKSFYKLLVQKLWVFFFVEKEDDSLFVALVFVEG